MSSRKAAAKADIPDMHAESVQELREAFDLFDTKGTGAWKINQVDLLVGFAPAELVLVEDSYIRQSAL